MPRYRIVTTRSSGSSAFSINTFVVSMAGVQNSCRPNRWRLAWRISRRELPRQKPRRRAGTRRVTDTTASSAVICLIICRALKSSSSRRPRLVPAAVEHCMSSVRINPSASTLFLPSIASSSPVGQNMAVARVARALARRRRRRISSKLAYPPRRCWLMSWSASMLTICRCIASTRSWSARASRSIAPVWRIGGGRSAFALKPIVARMLELLKRSTKLFCDETTVPVLDPGRGKTKTGYLWAIARDDRPWNGPDPPGVVYVYAPGRAGEYTRQALRGFKGVLQVDGYIGYNALTDGRRKEDPLDLALCWAHWRRDFFDINKGGSAPIAAEVLNRIAALYQIETEIRGRSAEERRAMRQVNTAPLIDDLFRWLEQKLPLLPRSGKMAEVIRYGLKRRDGLTRFVDDGTIEIDSNTVERAIRPITLNRKNALFAGHDEGAAAWGLIASLVETCKLNGVEPQRYLTNVLTKIAQQWPMAKLDQLLPWAHVG